eukprot:gene24227-31497_t
MIGIRSRTSRKFCSRNQRMVGKRMRRRKKKREERGQEVASRHQGDKEEDPAGRRHDAAVAWEEGDKGGVSGSSCGTITSVRIPLTHFFAWTLELELELEPWVSLWSNHSGEESTSPLAWASDIWVSLWANRVVAEPTSPCPGGVSLWRRET